MVSSMQLAGRLNRSCDLEAWDKQGYGTLEFQDCEELQHLLNCTIRCFWLPLSQMWPFESATFPQIMV